MRLLRVPEAVVGSIVQVQLREQSQKRLKSFRKWYTCGDSLQDLKAACLSVRLTLLATSISSKTKQQEELPLLVRLGRCDVQTAASDALVENLRNMHKDAALDVDLCIQRQLPTSAMLIVRYARYSEEWPSLVWSLSIHFNPGDYINAMAEFLSTPVEKLDAGFGVPFHALVVELGPAHVGIAFLCSVKVQKDIDGIIVKSGQMSLPVERKNNVAKQAVSAAGKVAGLGHVSRNVILSSWQKGKDEILREALKNFKRWSKEKYISYSALAVQKYPEYFPRGRGHLHWEGHVDKELQSSLTFAGDPMRFRTVLDENRERWKQEAKAVRANAIHNLKLAAQQPLPRSNKALLEWMDDNPATSLDSFQEVNVCNH